jgi:alpha-glucosidase
LFQVDIIRKNLIDEAQSSGWMHDFGEYTPLDCVLHDGSDPIEYHNRFPAEWAKLGQEAVDGAGRDDIVWFMRSGSTTSPKYARLFWMGDQMHTLDGFDGLASALTAMLQSGLSGFALGHSDVGMCVCSAYTHAMLLLILLRPVLSSVL